MSERFYADLIRHGTVNGHDAGPDDYDAALKALADVHAWAAHRGLDHVAALAQGMITALLTIDPRDRIPH